MKKNNILRFYRRIYSDNKYRIVGKRSITRDVFLYIFNKMLRPLDYHLVKKYYSEKSPIIFIVGAPRTGSTFLSQFLVDNFELAYINNYVARFWISPLVGAMLSERKIRNSSNIKYQSFLGNTEGWNSPHEFGYFWQYWMDHGETDYLTKEELEKINWEMIKKELYSIANYYKKPLLIKSLNYIDYKIPETYKHFPNSYFIYISRKPEYVIQSIYEARIKRYGNPNIWWSIKPKDYDKMKEEEPLKQVAMQFFDIDKAVLDGLKKIPSNKRIKISYESLVKDPKKIKYQLSDFFGPIVKTKDKDNYEIKSGNRQRLPDQEFQRIKEIINEYKNYSY